MSDQIEARGTGVGESWAIALHGKPLNSQQQRLLDNLPIYDSSVKMDKGDVSMVDLSALTAKTGDEFAMFTLGSERLVIRGGPKNVNVDAQKAAELNRQGYKWSGHTHVGNDLIASEGDYEVLAMFNQVGSVIYNAFGEHNRFFKRR